MDVNTTSTPLRCAHRFTADDIRLDMPFEEKQVEGSDSGHWHIFADIDGKPTEVRVAQVPREVLVEVKQSVDARNAFMNRCMAYVDSRNPNNFWLLYGQREVTVTDSI